MADEEKTLVALLADVQAGSQDAARQLYDLYSAHVLHIVRLRLPVHLRTRFDSLDFCQDVWASVFTSPSVPVAFDSPESLIAFLTRVAQNKVTDVVRQQLGAEKYDLRREEPLGAYKADHERRQLFAHEATPSALAIGKEAWEQVLEGMPPVYRRILVLLQEGKTHDEAAVETGVSNKTVQRVLARALQQLGS